MQKLWQFRFYCLDLARRWSVVSGPTGVSGPKDPDTPVLCFSAPCVRFVVRYCIRVRRYPEMVQPGEPESPVCPDDPASPEPGRNLRPWPESPTHLHRSLRPAQAVTASFWGRIYIASFFPKSWLLTHSLSPPLLKTCELDFSQSLQ